jgi:ABC-type transporter Mla subunit MlaD
MMPERTLGDPTPRTLDSLTQAMKAIEEKTHIRFEAHQEAVRLLQDFANRQPTTEAVNGDLKALKELTAEQFAALRELIGAKSDGSKTALDAALKTQEKALDEIKSSFGKQFENLSKQIDDLKERINRTDGRGTGRNDFIGWIVAAVVVVGGIIGMLAKFSN